MPRDKPLTLRRLIRSLENIKREHGDQIPVEMQRYDDIRQAWPVLRVHVRVSPVPDHKAEAVVIQ